MGAVRRDVRVHQDTTSGEEDIETCAAGLLFIAMLGGLATAQT